jgi:hypothetical protein
MYLSYLSDVSAGITYIAPVEAAKPIMNTFLKVSVAATRGRSA